MSKRERNLKLAIELNALSLIGEDARRRADDCRRKLAELVGDPDLPDVVKDVVPIEAARKKRKRTARRKDK